MNISFHFFARIKQRKSFKLNLAQLRFTAFAEMLFNRNEMTLIVESTGELFLALASGVLKRN
jgi:hypothetical protein